MAFAIGSITYTIYKLVSSLNETFADTKLQPVNRIDGNAGLVENLSASTARVKYDEVEITEIFENLIGDSEESEENDEFGQIEKSKKESESKELELPPKPEKQTLEDIYEEITITEYFLKYDHDYGDLQNLRLRNDFVFNAADLRKFAKQNEQNWQREKGSEFDDKKAERNQNVMKKTEDLKIQQKLAEKYTKRMNGNN